MSTQQLWLWLSLRPSFRPRTLQMLLERYGSPECIYAADRSSLLPARLFPAQVDALCDKDLGQAAHVEEQCARLGVTLVTFADAAYPDRLRQIPDPPLVLYVRGTLPEMDHCPAIAVVGTRKASPYGLSAAGQMAAGLVKQGFVVVSGMAEGIDGAANRAALRAGGKTVAVLGCGPDVCYPPMHRALMDDIMLSGAVVSEYPPGTPPGRAHFPARNRIISGLSVGTLVVEAPLGSGSLITARHALEQGRDVYVVPGNLDLRSFQGSNRMMVDGEAQPVICPGDIAREYEGLLPGAPALPCAPPPPPPPRQAADRPAQKPVPPPPGDDLSDGQRAVAQAVAQGAGTVDEIVRATGLAAAEITASLTLLELNGVLTRVNGRFAASQ